jgi:hypothetical protein
MDVRKVARTLLDLYASLQKQLARGAQLLKQ